jgi:predicted component of type VI protein secretion system
MSKIVLHVPGGGTRDIKLDRDRITIGRRADNDVHLPYPAVSAEHAAIITVLEDSFLEDLQSTNGTLVNGKRITKHFLRDHDAIDVGRVQLVYVMNDDELVESSAVAEGGVDGAGERATQAGANGLPTVMEVGEVETSPVDHLFAELMNSHGEAAVAVDIPPTVSIDPVHSEHDERATQGVATSGAYIEVMSGPNAGQIAPVTKREFVLGRAGSTMAVIRREGDDFVLQARDGHTSASVNGTLVSAEGVRLAFGDAIEVAGVRLRFGRRPPL